MEQIGYTNAPANLDAIFSALADPTRRAILSRLADGEASVNEIAAPFEMSQPAVSRHLKVLERAGLIETLRQAQTRPRRLRPEGLKLIDDWIAPFRDQWHGRLDRLDDYVTKGQEPGT